MYIAIAPPPTARTARIASAILTYLSVVFAKRSAIYSNQVGTHNSLFFYHRCIVSAIGAKILVRPETNGCQELQGLEGPAEAHCTSQSVLFDPCERRLFQSHSMVRKAGRRRQDDRDPF